MSSLDSIIRQGLGIKNNLKESIGQAFPDSGDFASEKIFGALKGALEDCLSNTPSVKAHQELFLNSLFEGMKSTGKGLVLQESAMTCKAFIYIEDQLLCLSDLFLLIDFENKERELNQYLNRVKKMVVLPILKSNSQLEAYLRD